MPLRYHSTETTLCLPYLVVDEARDSAVVGHGMGRSEDHLQCQSCCALQDSAGAIQGEDTPLAINIKLIIGWDIGRVADFQCPHQTFSKIDPVKAHKMLVQGHGRT